METPTEGKSITDVFMSIEAKDADNIARGRRSHEYRKYELPKTVERIWLYSKHPMNVVEYVICISHEDAEPVAAETQQQYGYRIHQVWMLRRPIGMRELIYVGALTRAPAKYTWVPNSFLVEWPYNKQYYLRQK